MQSLRKPRPSTLLGHLAEAARGFYSLLVGLRVTGRNFLAPQVTVHYPRETVAPGLLAGYRGHIELVPHPNDPDRSRCIVCFKCMRACPSQCIAIEKKRRTKPVLCKDSEEMDCVGFAMVPRPTLPPEQSRPELAAYRLDFTLCSLCGLCVQTCPAGAIRHSDNIYLASGSADDFRMDLLARLAEQAGNEAQDGDHDKGDDSLKEAV